MNPRSSVPPLLAAMFFALVAMLVSAATASAAATMTDPADGATVALDSGANFTFQWSLPAGEVGPDVWVGDTPTYDAETFYPFDDACGAADPQQVIYSCHTESPLDAGTHYAFIYTTNSDNTEGYYSPTTSFIVPPMLGWGCGPRAGCDDPAVVSTYFPNPTLGPPESDIELRGWLNSPGAPVDVTFTVKHRRTVLARIHRTARADSEFYVDLGFAVFQTGSRGPYKSYVRLHGIRGVKWLTCSIVMSGAGLTLRRTATFRAPPS